MMITKTRYGTYQELDKEFTAGDRTLPRVNDSDLHASENLPKS